MKDMSLSRNHRILVDTSFWVTLFKIAKSVFLLQTVIVCLAPNAHSVTRINVDHVHYIDVIMATMASQITSLAVVYSTVYSDADQRNIKAPRHWPLCREFTGIGEFPAQRASYAENVSIWWRHHALLSQPTMSYNVSICSGTKEGVPIFSW